MKEVDLILDELETLADKITGMENKIHEHLKNITSFECKLLVKFRMIDEESCLDISIINLNREIAKYVFYLSQNNFIRYRSNRSNINSNGQYEKVDGYLDDLENQMVFEYNCGLDYLDGAVG